MRAASALLVVGVCLFYGLAAPAIGREAFVDQAVNRRTVELMHAGAGYYPAMGRALRQFTGAPSTIRSFREPTVFLLWRVLPGAAGRWWAFVVMVAVVGLLVVASSRAGWVAPFVVLYLLHAGRPYAGGWYDQYLIVELWTVLPAMVLLTARARGAPRAMAVAAAVATLIRELSIVLVLGGLVVAVVWRRQPRVWVTALLALVPFALLHSILVLHYTGQQGVEAPLLGTGGIHRFVTMASVGLPVPAVAVAALWLVALARLAADRDLFVLMSGYVALPLLGLFVGRDYWGYLVVPFILLGAAEGLTIAFAAKRPRLRAAVAVEA